MEVVMNAPLNAEGLSVRVKTPQRLQMRMVMHSLDQLLPHDHQARVLWQYVCRLDLSAFYRDIQAVQSGPGRDAVDPRILLCLWLLATLEGISSARRLAVLCQRDIAYQWICGEVGVNRDMLNTFRCAHPEALDQLMVETIGTLLNQGLVSVERVAQDGMRVRASAGKSSFRRQDTLQKHLEVARQQVEQLRQERDDEEDPQHARTRQQAARERAARERLERIEKALEEREQLHQQRERRKKGSGHEARTSTTDPAARTMKMGDGGYRPAYNVQFATTSQTQLIIGVRVTNQGSDAGLMASMVEQIEAKYGQRPREYLADGGFNSRDDITQLEQEGTQVFAPLKQEEELLAQGKDPYARQPADSDEYFAFRQRMQTEAAKEIYKQRSGTAEFPNAGCRNRGLQQFCVRGLEKVGTIPLWQALAHNFQMIRHHGWLPELLERLKPQPT
jgi:transposase